MELERFEQTLREALTHHYDSSYVPSEEFLLVLGTRAVRDHQSLHAVICNAIEVLRPAEDVPKTVHLWRYYNLLSLRYIHEFTQKEAAHQLTISPRHLRREQQQAVRVLAEKLWERHYLQDNNRRVTTKSHRTMSNSWSTQIQEELALLYESDPNTTAHVSSELSRTEKLFYEILSDRNIALSHLNIDNDLVAQIHPSVLRQILITAIEDLSENMSTGSIELSALRRGDDVVITLIAKPVPPTRGDSTDSLWSILAEPGSSYSYSQSELQGVMHLRFPLARPVFVLVIEDNKDLIHVYRRYASGTQYRIDHLEDLTELTNRVDEVQPDIIVLDIMMPNVDGWELLTDLQKCPSTKDIPVIICSVVRQGKLLLALGATAHLPKPIKSQQFIETLDRVWRSVSASAKRN